MKQALSRAWRQNGEFVWCLLPCSETQRFWNVRGSEGLGQYDYMWKNEKRQSYWVNGTEFSFGNRFGCRSFQKRWVSLRVKFHQASFENWSGNLFLAPCWKNPLYPTYKNFRARSNPG